MAHHWPVIVGLGILVVAALLNQRSGRVPNPLTLGMIVAAWANAHFLPNLVPTADGRLSSSVACAFAALAAMLPLYVMGLVPAGCVKAQMAFGAWMGCALALGPALAATVIATLGGEAATVAAVAVCLARRRSVVGPSEVPIRLSQPPHLFPIQTPLTVGSLFAIAAAYYLGFAA